MQALRLLFHSLSVNSCELCSLEFEGLVLLVSSIPSGSYIISASSSAEIPYHSFIQTGSVLDTCLLI